MYGRMEHFKTCVGIYIHNIIQYTRKCLSNCMLNGLKQSNFNKYYYSTVIRISYCITFVVTKSCKMIEVYFIKLECIGSSGL